MLITKEHVQKFLNLDNKGKVKTLVVLDKYEESEFTNNSDVKLVYYKDLVAKGSPN